MPVGIISALINSIGCWTYGQYNSILAVLRAVRYLTYAVDPDTTVDGLSFVVHHSSPIQVERPPTTVFNSRILCHALLRQHTSYLMATYTYGGLF